MLDSLRKYKTKENFILLSIIILFSIIWLTLFLNFSTLWAQDSYWYARLGENLATGKGFTLDGTSPHAQYPIGLPLLIMVAYFMTKNAPIAGIIISFILSLCSIILAYLIGKKVSSSVGIISAILLASHNLFIFNSMSTMTETPFMFFSVLGLYLFMESYKKRILVIPAAISIVLSILIRYDGFFLIFPIAFYMFYRKKDFEDFFFSKKTFIAIGLGLAMLGAWFLRNIIAFGKPLINAHSSGDGSLGFSIKYALEFFSYLRYTGYLFPILTIIGIFFVLFKMKNLEMKTYLIWTFIYLLFHSWWWARAFRFYGQILILFCIFSAIALEKIYKFFQKNKKNLGRFIVVLFVALLIFEQLFIFYSGIINHETTIKTLNRYNPIKQASEYANTNLPEDAVCVFPEYVVYTNYLKKSQATTYQSGLNYLFSSNGTIYLFTDNHHTWITDPFIPKNGVIYLTLPTQNGAQVNVGLLPQEIKTFEFSDEKRIFNSTIWKIDGFYILN